MDKDDLSQLEKYLSDSQLMESDLRKYQGVRNIHAVFQESVKSPSAEPLKWTPMDAVESAMGLASYVSPQLKIFLISEICEKWDYCKKRDKFNTQLALACAVFTYISGESAIANEIARVMPVALCVATLVQTDFLNQHCGC